MPLHNVYIYVFNYDFIYKFCALGCKFYNHIRNIENILRLSIPKENKVVPNPLYLYMRFSFVFELFHSM